VAAVSPGSFVKLSTLADILTWRFLAEKGLIHGSFVEESAPPGAIWFRVGKKPRRDKRSSQGSDSNPAGQESTGWGRIVRNLWETLRAAPEEDSRAEGPELVIDDVVWETGTPAGASGHSPPCRSLVCSACGAIPEKSWRRS